MWGCLAGAAFCSSLLGCGSGGSDTPPRPNVVIVLVDTLRADHLGAYGYERNTSPNFDRWAADAIRFERAYTPSSWTKASMASLMTGLDPLQHNVRRGEDGIPEDITLLSERLTEVGYHTAAVVANPFVGSHFGFGQGYEIYSEQPLALAEDVYAEALRLLDERPQDKPFLLYVHTMDPHSPYTPPEEYADAFTDSPMANVIIEHIDFDRDPDVIDRVRDQYDAEILYHDHHFGAFIDEMEARGLDEDTIFLFVSDHGEEHFDHGRIGHAKQLFDEVVRIPMVLELPGAGGSVVDTPVSLVDVVPTLLRILKEPAPEEGAGVDLLKILAGDAAPRPLFFDLAIGLGTFEGSHARGVLRSGQKYIEEIHPAPREMLFDLTSDPGETRNLAEEEAGTTEALRGLVENWQLSSRTGLLVRVVGELADEQGTLEVRFTTDARIVAVDGDELEESDVVDLAADGKTLTLRLGQVAPPVDAGEWRGPDVDSLTIVTEPATAVVVLESIVGSAGEVPLLLGPDLKAGRLPQNLSTRAPALESAGPIPSMDEARRERRAPPRGIYVSSPRAPKVSAVGIPPDMEDQLRALGYLEGVTQDG